MIASSPSVITKTDSTAPLVIQVEAGGEYAGIQWTRTPIALNVSNGELVDFQQTFVRTVTSEGDWGLYQVSANCTQTITLMICVSTDENTSCKWLCLNRTGNLSIPFDTQLVQNCPPNKDTISVQLRPEI